MKVLKRIATSDAFKTIIPGRLYKANCNLQCGLELRLTTGTIQSPLQQLKDENNGADYDASVESAAGRGAMQKMLARRNSQVQEVKGAFIGLTR